MPNHESLIFFEIINYLSDTTGNKLGKPSNKVESLKNWKNVYCFIKITTMDPPLTPFLINDVFEENMHAAKQSE